MTDDFLAEYLAEDEGFSGYSDEEGEIGGSATVSKGMRLWLIFSTA